jgi:hypothetical protein
VRSIFPECNQYLPPDSGSSGQLNFKNAKNIISTEKTISQFAAAEFACLFSSRITVYLFFFTLFWICSSKCQ